ncbi:Low-density lipoprotein receptor class A domain-containing protein 4 [Nibea albiflora]|uniref:Low-density lipoprotein receptor class A domain-containing protein 4 n=1 Tax=Nibea albiflora TaxID=240163 RepID=A0ACB7F811_NIBAL|nr:Low-density lipoprotein receptor class A domain-containing protein 4 [Nibea albiflora]
MKKRKHKERMMVGEGGMQDEGLIRTGRVWRIQEVTCGGERGGWREYVRGKMERLRGQAEIREEFKLMKWEKKGKKRDETMNKRREADVTDGCLWPSDSGSRQGASEVLYAPQARDRFTAPSFMQRDRFSRFQPTYPYLQHQIDLPPTISLSDGEEPPPYQGPCTLQLRDPEQQMELNRESVRAPPNRTIYDSDLIDMGGGGSLGGVGGGGGGMGGGGPRPPSSNSGISAANSSSHGRMEGPPPAYSEVMGHYPGSAFFLHQHSNNQRVGGPGSRTIQQQSQSESTIVPAKAKDGQPEDLV